jgi:hypothetical protein
MDWMRNGAAHYQGIKFLEMARVVEEHESTQGWKFDSIYLSRVDGVWSEPVNTYIGKGVHCRVINLNCGYEGMPVRYINSLKLWIICEKIISSNKDMLDRGTVSFYS